MKRWGLPAQNCLSFLISLLSTISSGGMILKELMASLTIPHINQATSPVLLTVSTILLGEIDGDLLHHDPHTF